MRDFSLSIGVTVGRTTASEFRAVSISL